MEKTIIPVESIRERDVDLILLEEFSTDLSFCKWFTETCNLPEITEYLGAWRSITDFGLGETDLLVSYNSYKKKVFVLIENKLDTSFQNDQYERYLERAKRYIEQNDCDLSYTILLAPQLYCENQNNFEKYLTYEQVINRLEFTATTRNIFKSKLLKIATEKLRRGYQPINSEPVQKFWHSYWEFIEGKYSELKMKKPGIVPQNSDWPMLFNDNLKGITFYHKLSHGNSDVTFKGFPIETMKQIKSIIPEKFQFIEHTKSFSIRISSPKIDRVKDFNSQIKEVMLGVDNLEKIRIWLLQNKKIITD